MSRMVLLPGRKFQSRSKRQCTAYCFILVVLAIFAVCLPFTPRNERLSVLDLDSLSFALAESGANRDNASLSSSTNVYSQFQYEKAQPRQSYDPRGECGTAPAHDYFFRQTHAVRSSRNEDKTIYELFFREPRITNGTYVELGAFNGVRESNTRFFDVCLEWSGLLIEANPQKYPKLLERRPHSHRLNFAPSCASPQTIPFHSVAFTNAAQADVPNDYDNSSIVQVPCDRLTPVLMDILGGHVTFFSLDVEGAEAQVLATVDFDRVHVDLWMVEKVNNYCLAECETRNRVRSIFHQAGYIGYEGVVLSSDLYVRPHSKQDKILRERHPTKRIQPIDAGE